MSGVLSSGKKNKVGKIIHLVKGAKNMEEAFGRCQ